MGFFKAVDAGADIGGSAAQLEALAHCGGPVDAYDRLQARLIQLHLRQPRVLRPHTARTVRRVIRGNMGPQGRKQGR